MIRGSSSFSRHTLTKIEFRSSGASSVLVVGTPTLKAAVKTAGSAADAKCPSRAKCVQYMRAGRKRLVEDNTATEFIF